VSTQIERQCKFFDAFTIKWRHQYLDVLQQDCELSPQDVQPYLWDVGTLQYAARSPSVIDLQLCEAVIHNFEAVKVQE